MVITSSPVFRLSSTIDCVREHLDGAGSDWGTRTGGSCSLAHLSIFQVRKSQIIKNSLSIKKTLLFCANLIMERIKNWHILDRKMPITMAPYASDILVVIGAFQ